MHVRHDAKEHFLAANCKQRLLDGKKLLNMCHYSLKAAKQTTFESDPRFWTPRTYRNRYTRATLPNEKRSCVCHSDDERILQKEQRFVRQKEGYACYNRVSRPADILIWFGKWLPDGQRSLVPKYFFGYIIRDFWKNPAQNNPAPFPDDSARRTILQNDIRAFMQLRLQTPEYPECILSHRGRIRIAPRFIDSLVSLH